MLCFAKTVALFTFFAFASAVNVITSVTATTDLTPGQPFTITWTPDSSSTISLILRQGDASALGTVGSIVNNIPNTGSYTWYPQNTLPGGTDYAFEIVGSDGTSNYSHFFGINNPSVKAATTATGATGTAGTIPVTTLPENLVTDSLISEPSTATTGGVLIVSGNSTMTTSAASASGSSGSQSVSVTRSRSASQSIASATITASSASSLVSEVVGGTGLMTIIALTLSSMVFCMM